MASNASNAYTRLVDKLAGQSLSQNMTAIGDFQLSLPYFANDLPAPLPTHEQIENADKVLADVAGRKVVQVGKHYVVKYGPINEESEVATLIYLRNTTSINVPKVYAAYRSGIHNVLFIIMEFIPGETLAVLWPSLSDKDKDQVCRDVKLQLDQARNLPSLGYFGAVGRKPMPDGIFWIYERHTPEINGPFCSENELNNAIVEKARLADEIWRGNGPQRSQFYQRMLRQAFQTHYSVFTHADLQRKNILVQPRSNPVGEQINPGPSKFHVTLVDWALSGWYPSYWEYCAASWTFRFDDDWPEYIERIIEPRPIEHAWLKMIREDLWT